ncbi:hypothetical protein LTR36_009496 [Oleoguttula mirabilis]|uniref:Uncharacterized protein n=1 Tax=Oleoguttula mirabilis TaxID=1507867 RepID=A0AAV9JSN6_9PEZI|nr:hypothetical protein LTR36_009496 [Oleoguttula mirabilis]
MPPIPVHIDDPITPQKAQGVTPQTSNLSAAASSASDATTTTPNQQVSYPAARPGQPAVPAPTPYIPRPQPQVTRTTPPSLGENGPPPPQPGVVPMPPSQQVTMTATSTLPPPPKAGESLQQTSFTSTLNQMHIPPPQQNYAPTHSTTTATPATPRRSGGPTTLNLGPVISTPASAEHPPGYQQNVYAQEMSPAQRASLDQETRRESIAAQLGLVGETDGLGGGSDGKAGDMWNAAKGWLSTAGAKLVETEEQVWKRINGQ